MHLKHLRRGALVDVKDDDGSTCLVVSQEFPGLRGYAPSSDLARFEGDDLHAQTFTSLWEAPPLQEVHEGHIRGKVERVWLRRRGPWLDEVLQADAIVERSEGWAARCIKSGRAGAVFHPLQECEPVHICRGRLRDDELRSDDEADARGEPPPSLKPWDALSSSARTSGGAGGRVVKPRRLGRARRGRVRAGQARRGRLRVHDRFVRDGRRRII